MEDWKYVVVPGRGLVTKSAINYRNDYLRSLGFGIDEIEQTVFSHTDVQNNIESLVGSVEIPSGIVGPLKYNTEQGSEDVFCMGATLEGALIASLNRGAKAISLSGGFTTEVIHQKMMRSPLFLLSNEEKAIHFENWINTHFEAIKEITESYSNHATLTGISIHRDTVNVHTNFTYTTGDAAGQNMTTTCTWHGILWIVEQYAAQGHETITDFVLEGNGSSDKKVSQFLIDHGRGIKVIATAVLDEDICKKVLRTTPEKLLKFYGPSRAYAKHKGMVGYTINAANAIAAIFAATGQDLASIHESSVAELTLKKHPRGLEMSLTLFSLVVGTLGGGTHLPKQQEALQIMGCAGKNKVNRFASLIAGFALGLDLSTYSAMVSGEFAKAHEKLGRNKPVDWLQWKEFDTPFLKSIVTPYIQGNLNNIEIIKGAVDSGILMNLSKRVNRKLIGFIPIDLKTAKETIPVLIKSKGTDKEVIKGLHLMAASINPELSDLISTYKNQLEYINSHDKELSIPRYLHENKLYCTPFFYGTYRNESREIYLLCQERLLPNEMLLMDSENSPQLWTPEILKKTISTIHQVHHSYTNQNDKDKPNNLLEFDITKAIPLYQKMINIISNEDKTDKYSILNIYLADLRKAPQPFGIPKTLVHNDFSPRNIAIRKNGGIVIYDWELAVLNYPHRDIIELLSFTLPSDFNEVLLMDYLKYHFELSKSQNWNNWQSIYIQCLKEFLVSRISFYAAAEILMKLKFVDRVYKNCIRMITLLEK